MGNGAHGVAVLRAIWDGRDPGAAAATFIEVIEDAIDE